MQKLSAPSSITIPSIIYFFETPTLTVDKIFWQYCSIDIWVKHKINSRKKVISSCLEDYKAMLHSLYIYKWRFQYSTIGWDVISNVLKWFKRKQNLLSKEHYCYKIYISLMKSSDIPHFYKTLIPSFDFSKISISYKWESRYEKTKQFFIIHTMKNYIYFQLNFE